MNELNNCPKCNFNLNGEDIYEHFLNKYSKEGIPSYARDFDGIIKSMADYPKIYENASLEDLKKMSPLELAAWDSANNYGWTRKDPKCFRKEIGIEISGYYDGVVLYKCPNCNHLRKRFAWVDDKYLTE